MTRASKLLRDNCADPIPAWVVDWGPNEDTGRTFDLSPGLAERLGVETGDRVMVEFRDEMFQ